MSVEVESEVEVGYRRGRRKRVRNARMVECREWEHPLSLSFPYARGFCLCCGRNTGDFWTGDRNLVDER